MTKTLCYILGIALLASLLVNFYYWDLNRDTELKLNLAESQSVLRIQEADARMARRDTAIARIQAKMDSAAKHHAQIQKSFSEALNAKKARIVKLPDIVLSDSNKVKAAIHTRDSVIALQDGLIEDLTTERNGIKADCKSLTDSLIANIDDLKGIRIELEGQVQRRNEALSKEKKKGKWYKRGLAAAGAVILYLAIKE